MTPQGELAHKGGDNARFRRTILATCCIPWQDDGTLAEETFRRSIRALTERGLRDLYVFGTAGEGYAVTERAFDRIVDVFVDEAAACRATPMVGIISLSLPTVIERIERAASRGVREFQISLPSWGTLADAEVELFFGETCARFPELHFLHYNLPRSGRLLSGRQYAALAATHPNLVATKYGGPDLRLMTGLLQEAPALRHFFTEFGYGAGSALGAPGFLISFSSSGVRRAREYFEAGQRGDLQALARTQLELAALHQELVDAVGPGPHMDGAFDKMFSRLLVPEFPLRLLPPYLGASDAAFARYRSALRSRFPDWLDEG